MRGLEGDKVTADAAIAELQSVINAKKTEAERERKRKERLEKNLRDVKVAVESRQNEIRAKQAQVSEGNDEIKALEASLREKKQNTDRALKEVDTLSAKLQKLTAELEEQTKLNSSLHAENVQRSTELKHAEAEIEGVKKEVARHEKLRLAVLEKVAGIDSQRAKADDKRDELKVLIASQVCSFHLSRDVSTRRQAGKCSLSPNRTSTSQQRVTVSNAGYSLLGPSLKDCQP